MSRNPTGVDKYYRFDYDINTQNVLNFVCISHTQHFYSNQTNGAVRSATKRQPLVDNFLSFPLQLDTQLQASRFFPSKIPTPSPRTKSTPIDTSNSKIPPPVTYCISPPMTVRPSAAKQLAVDFSNVTMPRSARKGKSCLL